MPSDTDDNPFARQTVWPSMPQGAFKVGPLPKGDPLPEEPEPPVDPRQVITPVFVRPVDAPIDSLFRRPAPAGPPQPPPQRITPAHLRTEPQLPAVRSPEPRPAPVAAAPAPEAAPMVAAAPPVRTGKRPRSILPLVAAGLVVAAGIAGLAYVSMRSPEAAPTPAKAVPPIAAPPSSPTVETPPPAATATPKLAAAAPRVRGPVSAPRVRSLAMDEPIVSPSAAPSGPLPVIEAAPRPLPPPVAAAPAEPAYRPPPAPDPNAPVTTTRPY